MATIRFGPIIGDARGAFAGAILSRCPSGAVLRSRALFRSAGGIKPRQADWFTYLRQQWGDYPGTTEIAAWNLAAKTVTWKNSVGVSYHPSGFALYLSINLIHFCWERDFLCAEVPTVMSIPHPILHFTEDTANNRWTFHYHHVDTTFEAGTYLAWRYCQASSSTGPNPRRGWSAVMTVTCTAGQSAEQYCPYVLTGNQGPYIWVRSRHIGYAGALSPETYSKKFISEY